MSTTLKDIRSLSKEELKDFFTANNEAAFRGSQVYEWLWNKACYDFDAMTNLSKEQRDLLKKHFIINHVEVASLQKSNDGTIKNAIRLHDNLIVESVLIPVKNRTTACVSSQVGCSLDCTFCATASLKRMRNLNPDEIVDQVTTINQQSLQYFDRPLSNIVFMGMGEPLMNYNNVMKAVGKITDPETIGMSPKRITISTSGISKMIVKMADDQVRCNLAVSLHSAIEEVRNKIMPFTIKFSLQDLKEAIVYWHEKTGSRVTYEYVVWNGINDRQKDVNALVDFCKAAPSKVNLIEYNPTDNKSFVQATKAAMDMYITTLERNRIPVTVRRSRGKDIDAACGQLANKKATGI